MPGSSTCGYVVFYAERNLISDLGDVNKNTLGRLKQTVHTPSNTRPGYVTVVTEAVGATGAGRIALNSMLMAAVMILAEPRPIRHICRITIIYGSPIGDCPSVGVQHVLLADRENSAQKFEPQAKELCSDTSNKISVQHVAQDNILFYKALLMWN